MPARARNKIALRLDAEPVLAIHSWFNILTIVAQAAGSITFFF
jgi:hypothetical protein